VADSPATASGGLLAVFAHPDDESLACGGLLALAASHQLPTTLLCMTRGEHRGDHRVGELDAAARVLGIRSVDVLAYEDGYLPWSDEAVLEADIARMIQKAAPEIVVTFDEDGLYWHPDHVALHARTTAAVAAMGTRGPALYYVTMPEGRMRALQERSAPPLPILGITDGAAFGACAPRPSLVLDVRPVAAQKLTALRCHASQMAGGALETLRDEDAADFLGVEQFRRALVGIQGETWLDRLAARQPLGADSARVAR
jgi:N-acetyl-1-D-myo-inositol-2-amino-2-deoxy-alpha-D-glucopyranoside deacetylase